VNCGLSGNRFRKPARKSGVARHPRRINHTGAPVAVASSRRVQHRRSRASRHSSPVISRRWTTEHSQRRSVNLALTYVVVYVSPSRRFRPDAASETPRLDVRRGVFVLGEHSQDRGHPQDAPLAARPLGWIEVFRGSRAARRWRLVAQHSDGMRTRVIRRLRGSAYMSQLLPNRARPYAHTHNAAARIVPDPRHKSPYSACRFQLLANRVGPYSHTPSGDPHNLAHRSQPEAPWKTGSPPKG
jgi:hypothetical protein